jgi:hypothetical protein
VVTYADHLPTADDLASICCTLGNLDVGLDAGECNGYELHAPIE